MLLWLSNKVVDLLTVLLFLPSVLCSKIVFICNFILGIAWRLRRKTSFSNIQSSCSFHICLDFISLDILEQPQTLPVLRNGAVKVICALSKLIHFVGSLETFHQGVLCSVIKVSFSPLVRAIHIVL